MLGPMKTLSKIMEMFWLLLGIVVLGFAVYVWSQSSLEDSKLLFLVSAVGFAMYFFRKFMNRKLTKMTENEQKRRAEQP